MKTTATKQTHAAAKLHADLARARRKRAAVVVKQGWRKSTRAVEDTAFAREAFAIAEKFRRSQTKP